MNERYALVIGGAGFIGSNLADRLLRDGRRVVLLDALRRPGVEQNARWLETRHAGRVSLVVGDVRDSELVLRLVSRADQVYHLAAQVAVTTSLADPVEDFEVNARGTVMVLEALRALADPPPLVFTSTNKVYGALEHVELTVRRGRWEPVDEALARTGVDERQVLSFQSPYGCSKGAADQYVLDYARTFGLPACVLRMSCVYGPNQWGTEDQGWVAHFLVRAMSGERVTLYGDGRQVRDILYVDDLVEAMLRASERMNALAGDAYNLGGGPSRALSLREALDGIEYAVGVPVTVAHGPWRRADQRWYISDTRTFERATGWRPTVAVDEGLALLHRWMRARQFLPSTVTGTSNGYRWVV